mgnify:CR=1 FL=1
MIKKYTIFLSLLNVIFGQISMSDINKLSNDQLDLIKQELQGEPVSQNDNIDKSISVIPETVTIESPTPSSGSKYFGYNYFKRDINFFDNVPTPPDFKLGPGDEIILSLWGETNSRENLILNKEGLIYYENVGFINLSNKNLKDAESVLLEELSRIYSTLKDKDNPTQLMLELGKLKSINVYFSGQIENPGINLIHPFSDIFSAIVQAGGIKEEGSLRQVQLIRNGNIVSTVDFYSFFTDGKNNFSSTRILDGDVIHIPIVSRRVQIVGAINNPGFFELFDDESLTDLIQYAGNLLSNATSTITLDKVIPLSERLSDDSARASVTVNISTASNTKLNDGDIANVGYIGDVATKVEILGRVKSPGLYASNGTLKDILDIAGGFNDPLFRQSIRDDEILVLRKDSNQFYGLEFKIHYNKSDKFNLVSDDKIFVYENVNYANNFIITVKGEVNKRGSYQHKNNMTVKDAINLAEGFTQIANPDAIIVTQSFTGIDNSGNEIKIVEQVNDINLDYNVGTGATINVLPIENVVSVEGNVYNPGLITHSGRKSIKRYISLAGGMKKDSIISDIYVQRANGKIKRISRLNGLYTSAKAGDRIIVPVDTSPQDFDITGFLADLATTLANIAAILIVVDNQND